MTKQQSQSKETSLVALTPENYYSKEADQQYWSFSVFKGFVQCEAAEMYKLQDHQEPEHPPMPLLVGNYVHSYFESTEAHAAFVEKQHANLYQRGGKKKLADVVKADEMIKTLESDPFIANNYVGEKEAIVTGNLFGKPWRGKIDCLNLEEGYFIDLKTAASLDRTFWSVGENGRRHKRLWFEEFGYIMQLAIYQQLIYQTYGKMLQPFIFAVSKEAIPDHLAISFRQPLLDEQMKTVERLLPSFQAVVDGEREPERCEHCDYCRSTKRLHGFADAEDLMEQGEK